MTAPLVHAHDSRIHFKLDEISAELQVLKAETIDTANAFDGCELVLAGARLKNKATMERLQDLAADIAILREMLGIS
jgi:hypothetical protein